MRLQRSSVADLLCQLGGEGTANPPPRPRLRRFPGAHRHSQVAATPKSPTCCCTAPRNRRILVHAPIARHRRPPSVVRIQRPRRFPGGRDFRAFVSASALPTMFLFPPNPAPKYSVMIPKPGSSQVFRRKRDARSGCGTGLFSLVWKANPQPRPWFRRSSQAATAAVQTRFSLAFARTRTYI